MNDGLPISVQMQRLETSVVKWTLFDPISRADITLDNSTGGTDMVRETGTALGQELFGAATAAAKSGGNTGNGTCTSVSAQANAKVGIYKAIVAIAGTNAATWNLYDPNGKLIDQKQYSGSGAAAVFANDQIHATMTDGSTDFVVGDEFDITVPAGSGDYAPLDLSAVDGTQVAAAVLYARAFVAADTTDDGAAVIRDALVLSDTLIWPSGATTTQIAAAEAQLATQRIFTTARV
jgi:hypothetical protein